MSSRHLGNKVPKITYRVVALDLNGDCLHARDRGIKWEKGPPFMSGLATSLDTVHRQTSDKFTLHKHLISHCTTETTHDCRYVSLTVSQSAV